MNDEETADLHARIRGLEEALGQNDNRLLAVFQLPPIMNNLLGLLLTVLIATPEMIHKHVQVSINCRVAVYRLRKHLKPWDIQIHSKRNAGYWIDEPTKERIRQLLVR